MTLILKYNEVPSIDEVARALYDSLTALSTDFTQATSLDTFSQDAAWILLGQISHKGFPYDIWYNETPYNIEDLTDYVDNKLHLALGTLNYDAKVVFLRPEAIFPQQGKLPIMGIHFEALEDEFNLLKNFAVQLKDRLPKLETVVVGVKGNRDSWHFEKV